MLSRPTLEETIVNEEGNSNQKRLAGWVLDFPKINIEASGLCEDFLEGSCPTLCDERHCLVVTIRINYLKVHLSAAAPAAYSTELAIRPRLACRALDYLGAPPQPSGCTIDRIEN